MFKQHKKQRLGALSWLTLCCALSACALSACDDEPASKEADVMMGGAGGEGGSGGEGGVGGEGGTGGQGGEGGEPAPTGGLALSGLSAEVQVRFDELGVAHISCERRADCFEAQGYVHASHRFVQMDINRMFPQGRLSERIGLLAQSTDVASRRLFATRSGARIEDQMWEASSPQAREMLEAYARGVNAWLADLREGRNGAQLSEEYAFPLFSTRLIEDWLPQDSLSVALILIQQLTEDSGPQLTRGQRLAALGPELFYDLYGFTPAFPSAVLQGSSGVEAVAPPAEGKSDGALSAPNLQAQLSGLTRAHGLARRASQALALAREAVPKKQLGEDFGSNNWVVAPSRSASGKALLSNDPHLGLSNPSVWYVAHLRASQAEEGDAAPLDAQGFTLPGLPSVVIGHNQKLSWGMTTTYFDFSDVYLETLSESGEGVMFEGREVPFIELTDELIFTDSDEGARSTRLYVPHHGPVLAIDREAGVAVTLRWTAQDADTDLNFLLELPLAQDVAEAREALKNITTIGQNIVVADVEGQIGWFPYNRLPTRPWASPALNPGLPLPGDGSAEWGEPLPYEDLPQALNPELGLLATANNDMTGAFWDGDPTNDAELSGAAALQEAPAPGYRYSQIMRLLDREAPHTPESLLSVIHDHEVLIARRLLPKLISLISQEALDEDGRALMASFEGWGSVEGVGYGCPAGVRLDEVSAGEPSAPVESEQERATSRACLAFHALYGQALKATFADELRAADRSVTRYGDLEALARLLARPEALSAGEAYWDDVSTEVVEGAGETLATAANAAGKLLRERLGEPSEWLWGRAHTVTLAANLLSDAGINEFNHGPFPNQGGLYSVDVANPRSLVSGDFTHGAGASMRFVCELAEYPRCTMEVPGGQRHRRDSPHYDDLFRRWLTRTPTPMRYEELEIEGATVERWRFVGAP